MGDENVADVLAKLPKTGQEDYVARVMEVSDAVDRVYDSMTATAQRGFVWCASANPAECLQG